MRRALLLTGFVSGFLLTGCFDDPVAGGTVETENSAAARTIKVDSLLQDWNRPSGEPTVATLRFDSSNIPFEKTSSTGNDLAVERLDGRPIPFRVVVWDKSTAFGRVQVHLDSSLQKKESKFKLRWGLKDSVRSDSEAVWSGISPSQRSLLGSVLVDDFERATLRSLLPDSGWWYTSGIDSATVSSPRLVDADSGRTGKVLQINYEAPSNKSQSAVLGLPLAARIHRLRTLDSIVFWARGPGRLSLALGPSSSPAPGQTLWAGSLDSNWKRFSIDLHSLDATRKATWEHFQDSVSNLAFLVSDGTSLWLDDLRLHGIDPDDLK